MTFQDGPSLASLRELAARSGGARQLAKLLRCRVEEERREASRAGDRANSPGESAWELALELAERIVTLEAELRRRDFEARLRAVELEAIYQLGRVLSSTFEVERLMATVLDLAVAILNARCGALWLAEGDAWRCVETVGSAGVEPGARWGGEGPPPEAVLLPAAQHRLRVPIASERQSLGWIAIGDQERREGIGTFGAEDRRSLELLANQAAVALENAALHREAVARELLEREMLLASEMQRRILPESLPQVPGFELAAWNRPARHVSGDYFHFFLNSRPRILRLAVGDVSGKGVPAALLVSLLHSALVLLWEKEDLGGEFLSRLNRHLFESSAESKFVTLVLAELETDRGHLRFLNAGHPPGLLRRRGGAIEQLPSGGLPLGLFATGTWRQNSVELEPGDLVCLYTDGVTEAESPSGEEFGLERLTSILEQDRTSGLEALRDTIAAELDAHTGGGTLGDDTTLLLLVRQ